MSTSFKQYEVLIIYLRFITFNVIKYNEKQTLILN